MRISDWSSDVCSSDLKAIVEPALFLLTIPSGATSVNIPDVSLVDPRVNIAAADWDFKRTHELNLLGKAVYNFADDWDFTDYWGRSRMSRQRNNIGRGSCRERVGEYV